MRFYKESPQKGHRRLCVTLDKRPRTYEISTPQWSAEKGKIKKFCLRIVDGTDTRDTDNKAHDLRLAYLRKEDLAQLRDEIDKALAD